MCYVDFKKAFDSVWRSGLRKATRFLGYEDKIVRLLEALYKDTMSAVRVDGDLSACISEAETTNNKRLRLTFCIEAIQIRSIARPLCDNRASCTKVLRTFGKTRLKFLAL